MSDPHPNAACSNLVVILARFLLFVAFAASAAEYHVAPTGVNTVLRASSGAIRTVSDLITGAPVTLTEDGCAVTIEPGAFRLLWVEF